MNEIKQLREDIKRIAGTYKPGDVVFVAEVIEVSQSSCNIKIGELTLTNVKFFSQSSSSGNIIFLPKVGSKVTVVDYSSGNLRDLQVISSDQITSIKFIENGLTIEFDSNTKKIDIKNETISLKDLFQSLTDIIKQLTVATPAGPSGTPLPPTISSLTQFETSFKNLLK